MGYQIEVAFDMRVVGSMTSLSEELVRKAEKNNCEMHYTNYEIEGKGRTITRNHSVMTFIFPEEKEYTINFLRFIKEYKNAKIESISSEEKKCILIYASSKYLSMMDTYYVKKYKKSRHLLSTEHKSIIKAM